MAVDAGTIWASIRIRLDKLNADVTSATKAMDRMAGAINKSGKAVENLNKLGSKMSLMVTAPLVAAGAAAAKMASDYNESVGGIQTVFKEYVDRVDEFSKKAAKAAGLSMTQVNESATVLGASLQNLGYSTEEAADLTLKLTQRAADMAATYGTETAPALEAIQSLLRGQANPIERYAVGITEATIKMKAMEMGLVKAGKELTLQEKTQVRLALLFEQTAIAEGRFAEEAEGAGGKAKITAAEVKNMAINLGQELLPVSLQLMEGLRKLVANFNSMSDTQKKAVVQIAALAAGLGPLTLGISKTIQAVTLLKGALVALSANPIGLAIAGVMALGYGLQKLGDMNNQRMLKEVGERFGEMADEANLSAQKISDVQEALALSGKGGFNFDTVSEQAAAITQELGITYDQLNRIAQTSNKVSQEYKDTLAMVTSIKEQERLRYQYTYGSAAFAEKFSGEIKKAVDASKDTGPAEVSEQIRGRIEAEKEYQQALKTAQDLRRLQAIDDAELRELQIDAAEDYRDALVDLGYASENELGTKGQEALTQMIALLKELGAGSTAFDDLIEKVNALDTETAKTGSAMRTSLLGELEKARESLGEDVFQDLTNKVNAFYDKLEEKEAAERFRENIAYALESATSMFSALSSLVSAVYENKAEKVDQDLQAELEANGLAEESAVERAERELALAQETGDQEAVIEAQNALKKAQIEEKYAKKKAEIEYEGSMMVWNIQRLQAIAGAALSVMNAYAAGFKFGPIVAAAYAATAGVIGAIQVAAVEAARPVKSYQTGGIVRATGGGQVGKLAENGYDEYLFNMGPSGDAFARKEARLIAQELAGQIGGSITIINEIDGEVIMRTILPHMNSGQYRIKWGE